MSIEANFQEFIEGANQLVDGVFNLPEFLTQQNMRKYLECIHLTISSILKHYMDDNHRGELIRNHNQPEPQEDVHRKNDV